MSAKGLLSPGRSLLMLMFLRLDIVILLFVELIEKIVMIPRRDGIGLYIRFVMMSYVMFLNELIVAAILLIAFPYLFVL